MNLGDLGDYVSVLGDVAFEPELRKIENCPCSTCSSTPRWVRESG
jgi:hypothetical protein